MRHDVFAHLSLSNEASVSVSTGKHITDKPHIMLDGIHLELFLHWQFTNFGAPIHKYYPRITEIWSMFLLGGAQYFLLSLFFFLAGVCVLHPTDGAAQSQHHYQQ